MIYFNLIYLLIGALLLAYFRIRARLGIPLWKDVLISLIWPIYILVVLILFGLLVVSDIRYARKKRRNAARKS